MKISVEREKLLNAVLHLSRIVTNKTSYPILEGILFSAEKGKLTLISYNLETTMKKEIYSRTEEDGDIVISARIISEIVRKLSGEIIEITTDDKLMCHIKSESAVFDIMGMASADFPEMPSFTSGSEILLKGEDLIDLTNSTSFAVAVVEGTRPMLMGLNISVKNNEIKFVGIDGYRLAIKKKKIDNAEDIEFTVFGKTIDEAIKLISDKEEMIPINVNKNMISFTIDGYSLISRLIESEFVNYQKTIPESYKQRIIVKVRDLTNIIERISLLISDSFSTPVRCVVNEDHIIFTTATVIGRATETYETVLEGEPFEIGLSSRYLLEALKAVDDDIVQIKFDAAKQGVVISPLESEDYMYMIMPMRLK